MTLLRPTTAWVSFGVIEHDSAACQLRACAQGVDAPAVTGRRIWARRRPPRMPVPFLALDPSEEKAKEAVAASASLRHPEWRELRPTRHVNGILST
jgi:hypothetical protein